MKIKVQVKDILDSERAIAGTGINPWCVNEGGDGEEWREVELDDARKWGLI